MNETAAANEETPVSCEPGTGTGREGKVKYNTRERRREEKRERESKVNEGNLRLWLFRGESVAHKLDAK